MRRMLSFALAAVALTGCDDDTTGPVVTPEYEVTITNLSDGQPLTPPVVVIHEPSLTLFQVGSVVSAQVREIAENGNLDPMVDLVDGHEDVADFVVAAGDPVPPLVPGEARSVDLTGEQGANRLSIVAMLICTNDGFTGASSVQLPGSVGGSVTVSLNAYDAGSEMNTEDWDDLVPPCGPLTGVDSGGAGTGMSNPALAEGGVIHSHGGITGASDLLADPHDWTDPVAEMVVTRTR